jgi:hypothetical protein
LFEHKPLLREGCVEFLSLLLGVLDLDLDLVEQGVRWVRYSARDTPRTTSLMMTWSSRLPQHEEANARGHKKALRLTDGRNRNRWGDAGIRVDRRNRAPTEAIRKSAGVADVCTGERHRTPFLSK